jgi:hypothetical protein
MSRASGSGLPRRSLDRDRVSEGLLHVRHDVCDRREHPGGRTARVPSRDAGDAGLDGTRCPLIGRSMGVPSPFALKVDTWRRGA